MKKFVLNCLIGMGIGIIFYSLSLTKFKVKELAVYFLRNTNNAVWGFGTAIFNLILFFILGVLVIPLVKFIYRRARRKQFKGIKKEIEKENKKLIVQLDKSSEEINKKVFSMKNVRKITKILILLFSIVFVWIIVDSLIFVSGISVIEEEQIILGAHRGNSLEFIENTIPAFESSINQEKYNFIEFDVQYTKDKKIIVFHDNDLLRLQGLSYRIKELTYDELCNVSIYHIPLYEEVMDVASNKKPLNIEIKSQGNFEDDKKMVDFIYEDLKKRGIKNKTLISSISSDVILYTKAKYPEMKTGKIYYITPHTFLDFDFFAEDFIFELKRTNAEYLMLHASNLKEYDTIKRLMPENKVLVFWFFDDQIYIVKNTGKFYSLNMKKIINRITNNLFKKDKQEVCLWWC